MLLIKNIGTLVTCNGIYWNELAILNNVAMLIDGDTINWIGKPVCISKNATLKTFDANNNVIIPGLIDCHTHLIFSGNRANEFFIRAKNKSYLDIANSGNGILNTMKSVRKSSKQELVNLALPRLKQMVKYGTTTIEAKSGYGLNINDELKILDVIKILNKSQDIDIEATFLGAHTIPPEYKHNKKHYIDIIISKMLPKVAKQKIARFCDIFIEKNAFNTEDAYKILNKAKTLGLQLKVHAEQFSHQGGAYLAAKIGSISASHLEFINDADIKVLSQNDVVAEILPISQTYLGIKNSPPTRELIDAGTKISIATDFNPGSSMCNNIQLALRLAIVNNKLSCEQALLGVTKNAAYSLRRNDIGQIKIGSKADFCILNTNNLLELFSDWTQNPILTVFKNGQIIHYL